MTKAMGESLFELIKGKCISDQAASAAVNDIMAYLRGDCCCNREDITGYTTISSCNICGKHISKQIIGLSSGTMVELEHILRQNETKKTVIIIGSQPPSILEKYEKEGHPFEIKGMVPLQYGDVYCERPSNKRKSSREI